jgi:hypothetical protein
MNGRLTPQRRRLLPWLVVGGALALPPLWWGVRSAARVGDAGKLGSAGGTDSTPGAPANTDSEMEARRRGVEATVAARNEETAREAEAFRRAGWKMVATPPPDPKVVALDPALLDGREHELRVQIATTVAPPELAPRLRRIAREAREAETRTAAVEALGRIGTAQAQAELLALLPELAAGDEARKVIVPLLRPARLSDELARKLAGLLDGNTLTDVEKRQVAFTLALLELRDGGKLPAGFASPQATQLIDQMTVLAQRTGQLQGGAHE